MDAMLESALIGGGFAFAAAAQPGPLQAFLLARVASDGWRRSLPAALAPVISDIPIATAILLLLHTLPDGFVTGLKVIGGCVFLAFAVRTWLEWRRFDATETSPERPSPRTLIEAVAVNLVNPGPYLGWSLILGPLAIEAWRSSPASAVVLVASFYLVMVLSLAGFILLAGTTTRLGPRFRRSLLLASAIALAAIAVVSLWSAIGGVIG